MTASNQNPTTAAQIVPGETPGFRFHTFPLAWRELKRSGKRDSQAQDVELRQATPAEYQANHHGGSLWAGFLVDRAGDFWCAEADPDRLELDAANLAEFDPDEAAQMRALAAELRAGG